MSRALALVIVVLLAVVGFQRGHILHAERAVAAAKAAHDADRQAWTLASARSAANEREVERLRTRAKDGVIDAARTENAALARRAGALDDAAGRLRDAYVAAVTGEGSRGALAGAGSAPTAGAGLVLADLYRSVDDEATGLARAYDAARIAGLACERSYDSLTRRE